MSDWAMMCTLTGSLIGLISLIICAITVAIRNSSSSFTRATMLETTKYCEISAIIFIVFAAVCNLLGIFQIFVEDGEFLIRLADRWVTMTNVLFQLYVVDMIRRSTIKRDLVVVSFFPDMPYSEILKLRYVYCIGTMYLFLSSMLITGGSIWMCYNPTLKTQDLLRTLSLCTANYTAGCVLIWIIVKDELIAKSGICKFIQLVLTSLGTAMIILRCIVL